MTSSSLGLTPWSESPTTRLPLRSGIRNSRGYFKRVNRLGATPGLRHLTPLGTTNAVMADDLYESTTIDNVQRLCSLQPYDGYLHAS